MHIKQQTYKGHDITIEDQERLIINSKVIDYREDKEQKKWFSKYLPYTEYDSLEALGKAIAVDTEEFKIIKEKLEN
ncbi:MAG: hypothetical protein KAG20_07545 [Cocleimonas sp.]|nr:hypothetical protein [Cocleimonas sp.]